MLDKYNETSDLAKVVKIVTSSTDKQEAFKVQNLKVLAEQLTKQVDTNTFNADLINACCEAISWQHNKHFLHRMFDVMYEPLVASMCENIELLSSLNKTENSSIHYNFLDVYGPTVSILAVSGVVFVGIGYLSYKGLKWGYNYLTRSSEPLIDRGHNVNTFAESKPTNEIQETVKITNVNEPIQTNPASMDDIIRTENQSEYIKILNRVSKNESDIVNSYNELNRLSNHKILNSSDRFIDNSSLNFANFNNVIADLTSIFIHHPENIIFLSVFVYLFGKKIKNLAIEAKELIVSNKR